MGRGFNPRIFCLHVLCCYEALFSKQCFGNFFPYPGLFLLVILCISKNYEHFVGGVHFSYGPGSQIFYAPINVIDLFSELLVIILSVGSFLV